MKHFIYRIENIRSPKNGSGQVKCVTVWQLKSGRPIVILSKQYTFLSDFQAVLEHMEQLSPNPLPPEAYLRHPDGRYAVHPLATFNESKIATFYPIQ